MIKLQLNELLAQKHFDGIKKHLQERITNIIASGNILKGGDRIAVSDDLQEYLDILLEGDELKKLIKSTPSEMELISTHIENTYLNFMVEDSDDNLILRNIFISHAYDRFDKLAFINSIDIDSCTYCNRSYIYALAAKNKIKPEIDHYFPKTIFPFFAASFYNLIPSCQTCNGIHVKGNQNPSELCMKNPYAIVDDDFQFTFTINSIDVINPLAKKDSVSVSLLKKIDGNASVFKLDDLYRLHSDHALELIIKAKLKYSLDYRKYLESYTDLNFSAHEIDRMILGNYSQPHEIHKRPLAKLYQDLGRELGLIPKIEEKK